MTEVDNIVTASKAEAADGTPEDSLGAQAEYVDEDVKKSAEEIQRQNDLTDAQLKQIEEEQKQSPLVGDKIPFEVVVMEYDQNESPEYFLKAKDMLESFDYIRQIRRDGNCFYRAVLVAEIELMLIDPEECKRFEQVCTGWQNRLIKLGYPDFTTNDFCDVFYAWMKPIWNRETTTQKVFADLNDDNEANYLIIFMRLIAAGYLKEHTEDYEPFIDNGQTLVEYCSTEIEAMWRDADHLAVTGLVNALGRGIRVQYMDQSAAPNGGWHYDFPPDQVESPRITLLYRPGHYDLIYRK